MAHPSQPSSSQVSHKSGEAILQYQGNSFHKLLQHVWKHSSFYRDYYESCGIRERDLPDLTVSDLPFLSKKDLMDHFDQAITDPNLKKKDIEKWIHEVPDPGQRYHDRYIVLHTSGSSGDIAIFVYDLNAWRVMNGTAATFLPRPENLFGGRTRVACYLAMHGHFAGVTSASLLPRAVYEVLVASMLDTTEQVVKQLNQFQPHRISGYPSSVAMLADLALCGALRIHPKTLLVGGEVLTEGMKKKIWSAWQAPIYEMYSASESIYLAVRTWGEKDMLVVNDLNILEILDQDHRAVAAGQSGRVVLTNLYNYVLPILRYELGDYAIRGQEDLESLPTAIRGIQGRVNDALPVILDNGAQDTIHPIVLSEFYAAGLQNVQFISRRPDCVEIVYVAPQNIDESARSEFKRILQLKGAGRTTFEVRRVRQIDIDARTGKIPLVILEKKPPESSEQPLRLKAASLENRSAPVSSERFEGSRPQQPLMSKCFHPSQSFIEFKSGEIDQSIPARFEQQVLRFPDRIAIKTTRQTLTYEELNRFSNRIGRLIVQAVGKGREPVALQLEAGSNLIAAILGVLKAGKFYVYLDPSYPVSRIAAIAEDAQPSLIITDRKGRQRLKDSSARSIPYLDIDELDPSLPSENPAIATSPDTLAWLLYTSGSTGRPKGVVHDHRNLLHNIMTYTNSMHICMDDRLSLLHSCNVITSVKNLLGALLNGASVHPFDVREEGLDRLVAWMIRERITVYHSVPSLFRRLCDALTGEEKFSDLRLIALGSEPVTKRDVEEYREHFPPDCLLVNLLGNTEMGTYRQYFIDKATPVTNSLVPAGYEVEDKTVHIVDEAGREIGPAETGEIVVKSRYLAVGYWHDPAATRAAFSGEPNGGKERIYHTGDLGRMAADGCLTYLGRKDFQLKIRGHRLDLAEIEMALFEFPGVKDAVVVAYDDPDHEKRLVGYIVQNQSGASPVDGLRNFLTSRLPGFMVPAAFVSLDRLPLSPDGKIDRHALPVPAWNESKLRTNFVLPQTNLEKTVAGVWQEVLQLEEVGIHDNFFDLGGHSLLILAVHEKLRGLAINNLSVIDMLSHPTISSLARYLSEGENTQSLPDGRERVASRRKNLRQQKQFRQESRVKARATRTADE